MIDTLEPDVARETAKEPARRWVNQWQAITDCFEICTNCNGHRVHRRRAVLTCCCPDVFPSKDIAETAAAATHPPPELVKYVGATPEGERP